MSKIIFKKYFYHLLGQISPKIKNAQDLLNFGKFDISNILISIPMSKIIFIKYLPPVRPKFFPKSKVLRIYWNLSHSIFQVCQSGFWCQKWILWNIYQAKLTPRLILFRDLRLNFQVFQSWQWNLMKVSLNTYYMLLQNWSPILNSNLGYKM